ncbi:MAG: DUF2007 domain-containing protein [Acidobacteria bacterium]|nr:DUF2007 domain-containing protein [Acidobacteriota bacterium]
MIRVHEARNPAEAHYLLGLLQAEGLDPQLRGESLFTTVDGASAASGMLPSLWVPGEAQAARARQLLGVYLRGEVPPGDPWICSCGERHEPQFASCWACGSPRG